MEVILREHVDNLGRRGDVVKVTPGYARNYLLPRKLALAVTENNKRQIDREKKLAEARDMEEKSAAEAVATRIAAPDIQIALADPIKALGETTVPVKIHRDVTAQVRVKVVGEAK